MSKTVLVLNNPSSISILFTELGTSVDELWIELGATEKLDRGIARALTVLGFDRDRPLRYVKAPNLFAAGRQPRGKKLLHYREIAVEVDRICSDAGVTEVICSSTSSFRLSKVSRIHVVDHGTGDYLRTSARTLAERLKYAWFYSGPALRIFHYYAFLPLRGRSHLTIDSNLIRDRLFGIADPFARDRLTVVLLVYPLVPLEEQLRRLHDIMGNRLYDLYLKGHHFDPQELSAGDHSDGNHPLPRMLPEALDVLPAEFLIWGFDSPLRLAAFESTALWNLGTRAPDRVIALAQRDEILAMPGPYHSGLAPLEADLGYSPFR